MSCDGIAHPYIDSTTGMRKHVGVGGIGQRCGVIDIVSNVPGILISVSPNDDDDHGDGLTDFCRDYSQQLPVDVQLTAPFHFTAPEPWGAVHFYEWSVDGVKQGEGNNSITVAMDGTCRRAFARYYKEDIVVTNGEGIDIDPEDGYESQVSCSGIILSDIASVTVSAHRDAPVPPGGTSGCWNGAWTAHGITFPAVRDPESGAWISSHITRPDCETGCCNDGCTSQPWPCAWECRKTLANGQWVAFYFNNGVTSSAGASCTGCNYDTLTARVGGGGHHLKGIGWVTWRESIYFPGCGGYSWGGGGAFGFGGADHKLAGFDGTTEGCTEAIQSLIDSPFSGAWSVDNYEGFGPYSGNWKVQF